MSTKPTPAKNNAPAVAAGGSAIALLDFDAAEAFLANYLNELNDFLDTPFLSPSRAAEQGAIVTILRASEREAPSLDDPDELIPQYIFLVELQSEVDYKTRGGELKNFKPGSRAVISLTKNRIRDLIYQAVVGALAHGPVPNMAIVEAPMSTAGKLRGFAPAITIRPARSREEIERLTGDAK